MNVVEELILCHKTLADLNEFDYHLAIEKHTAPMTNSLYFLYKFFDKFGNNIFQSSGRNYHEVLYYTLMDKIKETIGCSTYEVDYNIQSKFKTNVEDFMFKFNKLNIVVTYN